MGDCGEVKWINNHEYMSTSNGVASKVTNPKYSLLGERLAACYAFTLCNVLCSAVAGNVNIVIQY